MAQPFYFTEGATPNRNDPKNRVITKILGRVQDTIGADNENNPKRNDTRWTLKEKWNRATWSGATPPPIMLFAKWFPINAIGNWNWDTDNQTGDWSAFNAYELPVYQLDLDGLGIVYTERFDQLVELVTLTMINNVITFFSSVPPNITGLYLDNNLLTGVTTIPILPISVSTVTIRGNQLTQPAVDQILANLDTNGLSGGAVYLDEGTNAIPSASGLASKASLEGRGWTVVVNTAGMAWVSTSQLIKYYTGPDFSGPSYDNLTIAAFNAVNPATALTILFYQQANLLTSVSTLTQLVNLDTLALYEQTHAACVSVLTQIPPLVTRIYFQKTNVTGTLTFPSIPSLIFLDISINPAMTTLNVSALTNLTTLLCQSSSLGSLDISALTQLTTLQAWDNGFSASEVDDVLVDLDANAQINGYCKIDGTNAAPTATGLTAKTSLEGKGWTVIVTVVSDNLITEGGDQLITEGGDNLITE